MKPTRTTWRASANWLLNPAPSSPSTSLSLRTITPHINGDRAITALNISREQLAIVFRDPSLVGDVAAFSAAPPPIEEDDLDGTPRSAGHTSCFISPHRDVYRCVQFPLPCGNVSEQRFLDIWKFSTQLEEVRAISHLARAAGLAWMKGPSAVGCEKSFVRTGIASENMKRREAHGARPLVQISTQPPVSSAS